MEEFAKTTPVNPPRVNKKMNPRAQRRVGEKFNGDP
jgi:hypothetical protein